MAKRQLGLSKAHKNKKAKKEETPVEEPKDGGMVIELPKDIDPSNEIDSIKGLWETYKKDMNELVLNGIIHECDRMLRNGETVNDLFYSYYGLSIAELSKYQEEEKVFEEALDRIDTGIEKFPESINLYFVKAKVTIMKYLNEGDFKDDVLSIYEKAEKHSEDTKNFDYFNDDNYEFLEILNHYVGEEEENAEEDEEDETLQKYKDWLLKHTEVFIKRCNEDMKKKVYKHLGNLYLQSSEEPSTIYTTLEYEDHPEPTINGKDKDQAQKEALDLLNKAVSYFRKSWDDEDVETWVGVGEALISLGNVDNDNQEKWYQEAEEILTKANNVTNGKYKDILNQLKED
ncbi:enhancer of translation termination 1 [[Candida] jaroonii]|uniref:Enhancer of translation termination 1 n=1 Tax=[Candida] jaroonii TaxID=467808 RepID=A0ACA9Y9H3_9ASCO|nr:enhancer of translation termination 1 [[Candida] jaroonii]